MVINAICNCWPSQPCVNTFLIKFCKAATLIWQVKAVNRTTCHSLEVFQKFPSAAKVELLLFLLVYISPHCNCNVELARMTLFNE